MCMGMKKLHSLSSNWAAFLFTVLFTVVIMVISGRDSWLYDAYVRCDTNWYFICGRALMNGLTPYVDFVDSKGPLLWLIYGVGYLLTPHSFIGVFWLECLVLLATLWIGYKMAMLFLGDRPILNLISVVLLGFVFVQTYDEWRCEFWCRPLLLYTVYLTCLSIKRHSASTYQANALRSGLCVGLAFMIKYSIAAMIGGIAVMQLYWSWRCQKSLLWPCCWRLIAGASLAMLPFVVYLSCTGAMIAFVREYCLNTLLTVGNLGEWVFPNMSPSRRTYLHFHLFFRWNVIWQVCACVVTLFSPLRKAYKVLALYCFTVCAAIYMMGYYSYYSEIGDVLVLFGIISVIALLRRVVKSRWVYAALLPLAVVWSVADGILFFRQCDWAYNKQNPRRKIYHTALHVVAQQGRHSKVMYFDTMPCCGDLGILGESLPACKHWARQNGALEQSLISQENAIVNHIPDVVVVNCVNEKFNERKRFLLKAGYYPVTVVSDKDRETWAERKQEIFLKRPFTTSIVNATDREILLRQK